MPNSMLQPSPISTTLAFSSRVRCDCSVALILSISALVITVAVVGFPGLGWAYIATGIRIVAASKTFSAMFFIVFLSVGAWTDRLVRQRKCDELSGVISTADG